MITAAKQRFIAILLFALIYASKTFSMEYATQEKNPLTSALRTQTQDEVNTELIIGIWNTDKAKVQGALQKGAYINEPIVLIFNNTALFIALETIINSNIYMTEEADTIIELLLKAGANPNIKSSKQWSPLFFAAGNYIKRDRPSSFVVKLLFDYGAYDKSIVKLLTHVTNGNEAENKRRREISDQYREFPSLYQEAHEKPTQMTLEKSISYRYNYVVKYLLNKGFLPHLEYLKLLPKDNIKTNELRRLLISYLRLMYGIGNRDFPPISRTGILSMKGINNDSTEIDFPAEIIEKIIHHVNQ